MSKVEADRKRPKTGGRTKGTPNKLTVVAKDAIAQAFDRVGGVDALVTWIEKSDDNRKVFYSVIHPKLIPVQVNGAGEDGEHLHKVSGALAWQPPQ